MIQDAGGAGKAGGDKDSDGSDSEEVRPAVPGPVARLRAAPTLSEPTAMPLPPIAHRWMSTCRPMRTRQRTWRSPEPPLPVFSGRGRAPCFRGPFPGDRRPACPSNPVCLSKTPTETRVFLPLRQKPEAGAFHSLYHQSRFLICVYQKILLISAISPLPPRAAATTPPLVRASSSLLGLPPRNCHHCGGAQHHARGQGVVRLALPEDSSSTWRR